MCFVLVMVRTAMSTLTPGGGIFQAQNGCLGFALDVPDPPGPTLAEQGQDPVQLMVERLEAVVTTRIFNLKVQG